MIPIKDSTPTNRFPRVTVALILTNVVVYLLAIRHGGSFISGPDDHVLIHYGLVPYAVTHQGAHGRLPAWETVFTAMFMHASLLHLAGNMLFLWIFGGTVEDSMGRPKFLAFYLLSGIAAAALLVALSPSSTAPTVGASGAIAGVLGGYIVLYPRGRVITFVFIILFVTVIELPALVMLALWFVEQAVFGAVGLTNPVGGGWAIAYFACLGGFVFGALTTRLLMGSRKRIPAF